MGNPNPGHGNTDPGIRNQIFSPMIRNNDSHYQLDTTFVTANHQIKCDASWSSKVFDNFKDYVNGNNHLLFFKTCLRPIDLENVV